VKTRVVELEDVIGRRRMVRDFTDEPVDRPVLERVLDALFRAPSAGNADALDAVVLVGPETRRYWSTTFADPDRRAAFRWQGLLGAPVLVVVTTRPSAYVERYAEPDKARPGLGSDVSQWPQPFWWVDAGMAVENLLLAAVDAGLGACFFGLFDHERAVLDELAVPADHRGVGTVALGWPRPGETGRSGARVRRRTPHWTKWSRNG
jgi:nitroreductase